MDDWRAWNGCSQMQPMSEKAYEVLSKKHNLLPLIKIIAFSSLWENLKKYQLEQYDIQDEDKVQEITVARTPNEKE